MYSIKFSEHCKPAIMEKSHYTNKQKVKYQLRKIKKKKKRLVCSVHLLYPQAWSLSPSAVGQPSVQTSTLITDTMDKLWTEPLGNETGGALLSGGSGA